MQSYRPSRRPLRSPMLRRKTRARAAMVTRRSSGKQVTGRWSMQTAARLRRQNNARAEETPTQPIPPNISAARKPEMTGGPRGTPPDRDRVEAFPRTVIDMVEQHRPSRMPFFQRMRALPLGTASDPEFLGDVHHTKRRCTRPGPRSITCRISTARRCASASCRFSTTTMASPAVTRIITS